MVEVGEKNISDVFAEAAGRGKIDERIQLADDFFIDFRMGRKFYFLPSGRTSTW